MALVREKPLLINLLVIIITVWSINIIIEGEILLAVANSDQPGLGVEKLKMCKDGSFHSARVDQAYRIIFSAQGDVMLLLWVDHHDDAYKWAMTHKCTINAESGAIQLYKTELAEEHGPATNVAAADPNAFLPPLFGELKDKQLMKLGVPKDHLEVVRGIKTEEELDGLQGYLPDEAYEGLYFLMLVKAMNPSWLNAR